ncbi:hypothetical protein [Tenacibaculum amylolyticum]|uniref:hypothetical protein n=1 Tax=Tenacibaculum amylolyticum TaxID=104269 RepID=UPI003893F484
MKSNKEILDLIGELIIKNAFDNQYRFIKNNVSDLSLTEEYSNLFKNMLPIQKLEIEKYTSEILKGFLFDILTVFEENEEFKVIFEENGKIVNLVEISDMLKAEPIIENGWIERFSKYVTKDK